MLNICCASGICDDGGMRKELEKEVCLCEIAGLGVFDPSRRREGVHASRVRERLFLEKS